MDTNPGMSLEDDTSPYDRKWYWLMIAGSVVGMMFGPAIAAFFGLAWPKRPGATLLKVFGVTFMFLHVALFIFWQAAPSWHPNFRNSPQPPGAPSAER